MVRPSFVSAWWLCAITGALVLLSAVAEASAPAITFDSPRGGEVYAIGQNQAVSLDPKTKYKSVKIELSTDGGTTFALLGTIDNSTKDATKRNVLVYTVAGPASVNCLVRATASTGKATVTSLSWPFTISTASGAPPQASITSAALAPQAITSTAIAPQAVDTPALANGSVTTPILADGAVTNPKIAAQAVTSTNVGSGAASPGMVLQADGNGHAIWATVAGVDPANPSAAASIITALNNNSAGALNPNVLQGNAAGGTVTLAGNASIAGTLNATGNTTLGGTLGVTGATTLSNLAAGVVHSSAAGLLTSSPVALSSTDVSGILPVAYGGTGVATGPVLLAPAASQMDGTTNSSILINKTATGNLLQLQKNGANKFVVDNGGNITTAGNIASIGVFSGNGSGLTDLSGANVTGNIPGNAASVTGMVAVLNGGTGLSSAGTAGNVLRSDGVNWTSSAIQLLDLPINALVNPLQVAILRWYPAVQTGQQISIGTQPLGLAFDGVCLWAVNQGSNTVTPFDPTVTGSGPTSAVGTNPYGVACQSPYILWVTNRDSNSVTKLGGGGGTFAVGSSPTFVAFDGTNIWVANSGSNNVTKLLATDGSLVGTYPVGNSPYAGTLGGIEMGMSGQLKTQSGTYRN
ncbi:MAG: hypothetical protein ABSE73_08425 [Planctomycetota bacterium]